MPTHAIKIKHEHAPSLSALRSRGGVDVCQQEADVWVRIDTHDEELDPTFLSLPGARFLVRDDGQLTPHGKRVPQGHLPDGPWAPLKQWMQVELPTPQFAGQTDARVALQLVRGGEVAEASVLLTSGRQWRDYATTAPLIRLERLSFAMNDAREVVVRGAPLPPLPGARFVEQSGIATPAGWTWEPALDAAVVRRALGLDAGDIALFYENATWDRLHADDFVLATRSAVRASTT